MITEAERNSTSFTSDKSILEKEFEASMVPKTFQIVYSANASTKKMRVTGLTFVLAMDDNEQLSLARHGNQTAGEIRDSTATYPADGFSTIASVSNPVQGVKSLIFTGRGEKPESV